MEISLQTANDDADITFNIPVPYLDADEPALTAIGKSFGDEGFRSRVLGVDRYALAACWVEVVITAGSFLAACTAKHYFDKVLNGIDRTAQQPLDDFVDKLHSALDRLVRPKYEQVCIAFRIGNRGQETTVIRRNKEEAHQAIRNALYEIWNKLNRESGRIYWMDKASFPDDGPVSLRVTHWGSDRQSESSLRVSTDSEDYPFWIWLLRAKRLREAINEVDLETLKAEFRKGL